MAKAAFTIRRAVAAIALLSAAPSLASEALPGGDETLRFAIGGILTRFDSNVRVDGASDNGSTVDLERNGLDKSDGNLVLSATWRPANRHRISATYFGSSRSGGRVLGSDIEIGDYLVPAGSTLDSKAKERYLFADYAYSIIKKHDVEIAGVLGLYASRFKFDLTGTTTGTVPKTFTSSSSTTVPLPLIGASVDWYVAPRLQFNASLTGLKAKIGDIDGSVWLLSIGTEYMFLKNFGVGISFLHTGVNVAVSKTNFKGVIDWNSNNALLYAVAKF